MAAPAPVPTTNILAMFDALMAAIAVEQSDAAKVDALSKQISGALKAIPPIAPDTTPPSTPTALTPSISGNVIQLNWTASTDNILVAGYRAYRSTSSGGTYTLLNPTVLIPAVTYADPSATVGTTWFYKVTAVDSSNNESGFSNIVSETVTTSDVTAPNIPGVPTLVSGPTSTSPPTAVVSFAAVTDINPGDGSPVSGEKDYLRVINGTTDTANPIPNSLTVGSPTPFVIGTNTGGTGPVTGSDSGTVVSTTSTTGDTSATHFTNIDEYFTDGAIVQGPGFHAIHVTARTLFGAFSKFGIESRQDRSNNCQYIAFADFGVATGLKAEWRLAAGAQALGSSIVAHPGFPYWQRERWTSNSNTDQTFVLEYSTDSTNPNPVGGNGTWSPLVTQEMSFNTQWYLNKYADANTAAGGTGGTTTGTYDQYVVGGASPILDTVTLIAGQANTVAYKSRDVAGNISAVGSVLTITPSAPAAGNSLAFGNWFIGGSAGRYDNATFQQYASVFDTNVMQWFSGYDTQVSSQSMKTIMGNIKALNPNTKCFLYLDCTYLTTTNGIASLGTAMNAFLRNTYSSGALVTQGGLVPPNTSISRIGNTVPGGPTDGAGRTWNQLCADYTIDYSQNGGAAGLAGSGNVANPLVDGYVTDDNQTRSGFAGDWLRNGTTQAAGSNASVNTAIRQGAIQILRFFQSRGKSGLLVGGNVSWFNIDQLTEYIGQLDWVYMENMIGGGNGNNENNSNFANAVATYQRIMTLCNSTGVGVFNQANLNASGQDFASWNSSTSTGTRSPSWVGARYGHAFNFVMGNAQFFPCGTDPFNSGGAGESYSTNLNLLRWFDFYLFNPATGAGIPISTALSFKNCLGPWIDGPQTTPFQLGMYRRRATNGEIWINPKGNGARTATFGRTVKLVNSAQDPAQNGASITSFNFGDRDGLMVRY